MRLGSVTHRARARDAEQRTTRRAGQTVGGGYGGEPSDLRIVELRRHRHSYRGSRLSPPVLIRAAPVPTSHGLSRSPTRPARARPRPGSGRPPAPAAPPRGRYRPARRGACQARRPNRLSATTRSATKAGSTARTACSARISSRSRMSRSSRLPGSARRHSARRLPLARP
jgi:hypothetical protein